MRMRALHSASCKGRVARGLTAAPAWDCRVARGLTAVPACQHQQIFVQLPDRRIQFHSL